MDGDRNVYIRICVDDSVWLVQIQIEVIACSHVQLRVIHCPHRPIKETFFGCIAYLSISAGGTPVSSAPLVYVEIS
jgi:hypothetical protein